jgi:hypothetical protein
MPEFIFTILSLSLSCPTHPHCRYIDMVTRDREDPRNKEEGERGPGGVRMVVMRDLLNSGGIDKFYAEMRAPGSHLYDEISKMKVGRAAELPGALIGGPGTFGTSLGLTSLLPPPTPAAPAPSCHHTKENHEGAKLVSEWIKLTNSKRRGYCEEAERDVLWH